MMSPVFGGSPNTSRGTPVLGRPSSGSSSMHQPFLALIILFYAV